MNIKNLTFTFIIGLLYEILLHICTIFINIDSIYRITHLISILLGLVILAFIIEFYKKEKSDKTLKRILEIIIVFFVVSIILSLSVSGNMNNLKMIRLLENIIRLINAVLFFILLIHIRKIIKVDNKVFLQAATLLTFILGIGIFIKLYSIITYLRFFISGVTAGSSPLIVNGIFVLFLLNRLSLILFLYRYYKNGFVIGN
jgi:hypothetical protein